MNLEQLAKRDRQLLGLLQQAQQWQRLDGEVKRILPQNLRAHFQTACVQEGCLILLAANNMAASRLKMILPTLLPQLQLLRSGISEVKVRLVPQTPKPQKANTLKLSPTALQHLETGAAALQHKHPDLALALADLVRRHKPKP